MTYPKPTYTCLGRVSGCCGIRHRSRAEAERCIERAAAASEEQDAYFDRRIVLASEHEYALAAARQVIELPADIALSPVGLVATRLKPEIPDSFEQLLLASGLSPDAEWRDDRGLGEQDTRDRIVLEIVREDARLSEGLSARLAVLARAYHLLVLPAVLPAPMHDERGGGVARYARS